MRKGKYREGFAEKLLGLVPRRESDRPCLWFHAVSVGEVNLLGPLLAELARERPEWECVVSTTTMTGFALARKKYAGRSVFYCPLDFSWAVRRALARIRPSLLVLAELELWPNLIHLARKSGAKVAVVNGRLSPRSFRGYNRFRRLVAPLTAELDLIAAQNDEYAERFLALGAQVRPETVHVSRFVEVRLTGPRPTAAIRSRSGCGRWPVSHRMTSCSLPAARRSRKRRAFFGGVSRTVARPSAAAAGAGSASPGSL